MNLRDQMWINRCLGGNSLPVNIAKRMLAKRASTSGKSDVIRILDAGCGGGDLARALVDELRRIGLNGQVVAVDSNPSVINAAKRWSSDYPEIDFIRANILTAPFDDHTFDLIVASHMLHHLGQPQAIELLKVLSRLSRGHVIVQDLKRSPVLAFFFPVMAHAFGFHPMSRFDGTVSLRRAWTVSNLKSMIEEAGLKKFYVHESLVRMTLIVS